MTAQAAVLLADRHGASVDRDGIAAADVLQQQAERLSSAEMLAIRNIVSSNVAEVERLTRELGSGPVAADAAERLERDIALREQQNAALLGRFTRARTAAGRNLNNLKILAQRTNDPVVWLAKARQIAGEAGFTQEVQTTVRRLLTEGKRPELVQYLAKLRQAPWWQKLATVWKAGLLTNPKTHAVNVASNTTMAVLETVKDNPAVFFDRLLALHTGQITKAPTSFATVRASLQGAREGTREAWRVLRGQASPDILARFDIPKEVHFDNALLETYTQTVFRLLDAEDRVFRGAALRRSLAEQAEVLAQREGLKGQARAARARELLTAPTDEMVTQAMLDAEVATFRDQTALGSALAGMVRPLGLAGEVLAPFRRTPSAVATRVVEYSPFGLVKGGWEAYGVWRAATRGQNVGIAQRRAAEILGRATTGSGAIALGWLLYQKGLATGAAPTFSPRDREQWRTEGKKPNSVLINGEWRNVGRLSPAGNLIALGANLAAAYEGDPNKTVGERVGELGASTIRTVADQPFVTGLRTATEAVVDPQEAAGRWLTGLVGSAVPAGVAALARSVDPVVRKPESVSEVVQSRIPFASQELRAKRDVFGQPERRTGGAVGEMLDPTSPSRDRRADDPLVAELSRVGAGITPLKQDRDETDTAFDQRQQVVGGRLRVRLERIVQGAGYQRADVERQREIIEDAVTELRRQMSRRRRGSRGD